MPGREGMPERFGKSVGMLMAGQRFAIEGLAREYLAHTGLKPDQVELVEDRSEPGVTRWYFRPLRKRKGLLEDALERQLRAEELRDLFAQYPGLRALVRGDPEDLVVPL